MNYEEWCLANSIDYESLNSKIKKGVKVNKIPTKKKESIMDVKNVLTTAADTNKTAMKQAGLIKVGKTANTAMIDILSDKLLPKKYKKLANNEFFALAVSNLAAVAMKQMSNTKKTTAVADAMVLSSMIDITNLIDFNQIIKDVMKDVDLSSLGLKDND